MTHPATTEIYTFPYTTLFRSTLFGIITLEMTGIYHDAANYSRQAEPNNAPVEARSTPSTRLPTVHPFPKIDRKSTRLNSSHTVISYAVFCLKKKKHSTYTNYD